MCGAAAVWAAEVSAAAVSAAAVSAAAVSAAAVSAAAVSAVVPGVLAGAATASAAGTDGVAAVGADALMANGCRGTAALALLRFAALAASATAWMPSPPGIRVSAGNCKVIVTLADPVTSPRPQLRRAAWISDAWQVGGKMDHRPGRWVVTANRVPRAVPPTERTVTVYAAKRIPSADDCRTGVREVASRIF
jgi:hypothetical protein